MDTNKVKIENEIDNLVNNVVLHITDIIGNKIVDLGIQEYAEEYDKLKKVENLLSEIERGCRKKAYNLKWISKGSRKRLPFFFVPTRQGVRIDLPV